MFLLVTAGNAHNDAIDIAVDRINRPDRPLAAGSLRAESARRVSLLLYLLAIIAAWMAAPLHALLAVSMAALLVAYNLKLKGLPLAGNAVIALLCALAVYFTEFPSPPGDTLPALLFAFVATLARELVKDAEDVAGDRAAGLRTLAVLKGPDAVRKAAFVLLVMLILLLPWPMLLFGYRWPYALGIVVLAGPFLVPLTGELSRPGADFTRCRKLLKGLMAGGMIALLAGVAGR